jgi:hypothetical protein
MRDFPQSLSVKTWSVDSQDGCGPANGPRGQLACPLHYNVLLSTYEPHTSHKALYATCMVDNLGPMNLQLTNETTLHESYCS